MSIRLGEAELKKIIELSKKEQKEKSAIVRELIQQGLIYRALAEYREGRKSLGTLASEWGLSLSRTIDLLSELGVEAPLEMDEYLEGLETARKVLKT